jgi:threonyl-tRNA synthetase
VGEKERNNGTVNVRTRDNKVHGEFLVPAVIEKLQELAKKRVLLSEEWDENKKE